MLAVRFAVHTAAQEDLAAGDQHVGRSLVGEQGREGRIGSVAKVQSADGDGIVLHLAVRSRTDEGDRAVGGATETGKGGARNRGEWDREAQRVAGQPGDDGLTAGEEIFARTRPVAVAIKVEPRRKGASGAGADRDLPHLARDQYVVKRYPIFVVAVGAGTEDRAAHPHVVALGGGGGLAVGIGIDTEAQVEAATQRVAGAIAG